MIQRFSTNFGTIALFIDLTLSITFLYISRIIRYLLYNLDFVRKLPQLPDIPGFVFFVFPIIWVTFLFANSVYDGKKNLKVIDEFSNITLASILSFITMAGLLYLSYRDISRAYFVIYFLLTYASLIVWRIIARSIYRNRVISKGYAQKILVIGAGPVGENVKEKILQSGATLTTFFGFLDDATEKISQRDDVLDSIDDVRAIVINNKIDHVILALPKSAHTRMDFVIKHLEDVPVRISIVPDYFHLTVSRMALTDFLGLPMLDLRSPAITEQQRLLKRIFDMIVTTMLLIPVLPIMAIISGLILIFDGVPVLFVQRRIGEGGRVIKIYKFRTMVKDAEKQFKKLINSEQKTDKIYKIASDPRVTPLGKILRRFSLDELPQFFNVLRGTLSLVGPRPELPAIVAKYEPWQRARLAVPQGLTGWWQIQGRSDKPLHLNTELDLYYIEHYSLWLDIRIIIKTIWIILRGKGAY